MICILEGPEDDSIRIETCCPNTIIINNIDFFDVLLTVHLSTILAINQLNAQIIDF